MFQLHLYLSAAKERPAGWYTIFVNFMPSRGLPFSEGFVRRSQGKSSSRSLDCRHVSMRAFWPLRITRRTSDSQIFRSPSSSRTLHPGVAWNSFKAGPAAEVLLRLPWTCTDIFILFPTLSRHIDASLKQLWQSDNCLAKGREYGCSLNAIPCVSPEHRQDNSYQ